MVLAVVVVAPGALLAAPLKHAFADFMVGTGDSKTVLDLEPTGYDGRGLRQAGNRRHPVDGAGGGGAHPVAIAAARLSAREGLFKLADLQTDALGAPQDTDPTLIGDDGDDGLISKAQDRPMTQDMSASSPIGGRSPGGGFSGGVGGGGGSGGGAPAAGSSGAAGLGDSAPGPEAVTNDPSLLGNAPSALSAAPEPAAWVSLILGFGLTGAMLRRRQRLA